ncbi:MAG: substrate-binding domain-containing protein [Pirellulales bacterium]|nr:substrate-binding domain-containing protein [Pirellulales bacterium]
MEHTIQSAHLNVLTEKLVADIERRGLCPGERYLTTDEVSRMLGVRKAVANRAMQTLAEKEILIRRQRSGTFIGPRFVKPVRSQVQVVHVLLPKDDICGQNWSMNPFVQGIRSEFPDVNVQFSYVPLIDGVSFVRELIDAGRQAGQLAGVIPVTCAPEVYRFLGEQEVPTVVYGSLYTAQDTIHSVDIDNRESGRLLMQFAVDRGHRRIALLAAGDSRPGDNDFFDGVSEVAAKADLPHTALIQRFLPRDLESYKTVVRELLGMPERPTACITRLGAFGHAVEEVAEEHGLRVPADLEIILDNEGQIGDVVDVSAYPRVEPKLSFPEIAGVIGRRLRRLAEGETLEPEHIKIPVVFHQPKIRN